MYELMDLELLRMSKTSNWIDSCNDEVGRGYPCFIWKGD